MKRLLVAFSAAAFLAGSGMALAGDSYTTGSATGAKAGTSVTVKAKKAHKRWHVRRSYGIGPENNAAARGSLLPGKDAAYSKAYIQDH